VAFAAYSQKQVAGSSLAPFSALKGLFEVICNFSTGVNLLGCFLVVNVNTEELLARLVRRRGRILGELGTDRQATPAEFVYNFWNHRSRII